MKYERITSPERECRKCLNVLPIESFRKRVNTNLIDKFSVKYDTICKNCDNAENKERRARNNAQPPTPERLKKKIRRQIVRRLKIKDESLLESIASEFAQKNFCHICGKTEKEEGRALCIDHCHDTNKIRGLLCSKCNFGLGSFNDSIDSLEKAIEYLKTAN